MGSRAPLQWRQTTRSETLNAGDELIPIKFPKVLGIADPSAFRVGENVVELLAEYISRSPVTLGRVAGNWVRTELGTVNVFCPAVVIQMNSPTVVIALFPWPVVIEDSPRISTWSDALPPVQLRIKGELRVIVVGKGFDRVSGEGSVSEALNGPTSLPPAPLKA